MSNLVIIYVLNSNTGRLLTNCI